MVNLYDQLIKAMLEYDSKINIENVKKGYDEIINSKRRIERISSLEDLIKILEKRGELHSEDIEILKNIANEINEPDLNRRIHVYDIQEVFPNITLIEKKIQKNYGGYKFPSSIMSWKSRLIKEKKFNNIVDVLTSQIGSYFTKFAEKLDLQEVQIDTINNAYKEDNKMENKIREVLQIYEKKRSNEKDWYDNVSKALREIKREDLEKSIFDILYG